MDRLCEMREVVAYSCNNNVIIIIVIIMQIITEESAEWGKKKSNRLAFSSECILMTSCN